MHNHTFDISLRALGLLSALALGACEPKLQIGEIGEGDGSDATTDGGDGVSTTGGDPQTTGTGGAPEATGDTTTAGDETTAVGTTGGTTGADEPVPACVGIDHPVCYPAALDACVGFGNWDVTQGCVDAVTACYPYGTEVLTPTQIILACAAELNEDCLFNDGPGCGETFCACTAGGYPYDWDNCWHLTLLACDPGLGGNCEEVLAVCYPGATPEEYSACKFQVDDELDGGCNCPMCSVHEQCEDALDVCLGK